MCDQGRTEGCAITTKRAALEPNMATGLVKDPGALLKDPGGSGELRAAGKPSKKMGGLGSFGRPGVVDVGVWAASGGRETFQKDGGLRPPSFWRAPQPPRGRPDPRNLRFPVGQKIICSKYQHPTHAQEFFWRSCCFAARKTRRAAADGIANCCSAAYLHWVHSPTPRTLRCAGGLKLPEKFHQLSSKFHHGGVFHHLRFCRMLQAKR